MITSTPDVWCFRLYFGTGHCLLDTETAWTTEGLQLCSQRWHIWETDDYWLSLELYSMSALCNSISNIICFHFCGLHQSDTPPWHNVLVRPRHHPGGVTDWQRPYKLHNRKQNTWMCIMISALCYSPREHANRAGLFSGRTTGAMWIYLRTAPVRHPECCQTRNADTAVKLQCYGMSFLFESFSLR
jgi:hypothetical protein